MIDWLLVLALLLLIGGVIGSIYPSIPGPILSIIGVTVYWWSTGYSTPSTLVYLLILFTGIFAVAIDYIATYLGAEKAQASERTAYMAAAASFILFFVSGPLGIIIGTVGVILLREMMLGKDFDKALKTAVLSGIALLTSVIAKVGLTGLMLLIFVISIVLA